MWKAHWRREENYQQEKAAGWKKGNQIIKEPSNIVLSSLYKSIHIFIAMTVMNDRSVVCGISNHNPVRQAVTAVPLVFSPHTPPPSVVTLKFITGLTMSRSWFPVRWQVGTQHSSAGCTQSRSPAWSTSAWSPTTRCGSTSPSPWWRCPTWAGPNSNRISVKVHCCLSCAPLPCRDLVFCIVQC